MSNLPLVRCFVCFLGREIGPGTLARFVTAYKTFDPEVTALLMCSMSMLQS